MKSRDVYLGMAAAVCVVGFFFLCGLGLALGFAVVGG